MTEIRLSIAADDSKALKEILQDLHLTHGSYRIPDTDATLTLVNRETSLGMVGSEVAILLLLQVTGGVATKVIGEWLTRVLNGRAKRVTIEGRVTEPSNAGIKAAIDAATTTL